MRRVRHRVVVTPEQVEIALRPAGAGRRGLALLLDSLAAIALALAAGQVAGLILPGAIATAASITAFFVATWGWHVWFELRSEGRTPGKRTLDLRVVDARGLPLTAEQSVVRNVARALDGLPIFYGVGAVAWAIDPMGRRCGDRLADTIVIHEGRDEDVRAGSGRELDRNTLDTPRVLRKLRKRLSAEEREFLLALTARERALTPAARYDLMEEVAGVLRRRLHLEVAVMSSEALVRAVAALVRTRAR